MSGECHVNDICAGLKVFESDRSVSFCSVTYELSGDIVDAHVCGGAVEQEPGGAEGDAVGVDYVCDIGCLAMFVKSEGMEHENTIVIILADVECKADCAGGNGYGAFRSRSVCYGRFGYGGFLFVICRCLGSGGVVSFYIEGVFRL